MLFQIDAGDPQARTGSQVPTKLLLALAIQIVAAVFFVFDAFAELLDGAGRWHPFVEAPIALALCIGITFVARDLAIALRRSRDQQSRLDLIAEEFSKVVNDFFDDWKLTGSERAVAQLSLKGLEVKEIARQRHAAEGTIRAQLARIYEKSGAANRAQLAAILMTAVMGDGVAADRSPADDLPG